MSTEVSQLPKPSPLKDDRLDDPSSHIEVVFDGSITLWRSATNLDVIVVNFEQFQCMELIVFHPSKNKEAPRIYIDFNILEKHLPRAEMQARIEERKELFLRRHRTYVAKVIEKEVELNIMSNYIVSRIAMKENKENEEEDGNPSSFEIELQAHFGDTVQEDDTIEKGITTKHLDFVIHKPEALVPIHTEHFAKPSIEHFERTLSEFIVDQKSAQSNFAMANKLLRVVELAANAFKGGKSGFSTNPNMSTASRRWKRSINRVINMIMCERIRRQLYKKQSDALLKNAMEANVEPHHTLDLNIKGLGPLNELGILPAYHRSKFENHMHKSKEQRHQDELNQHNIIHILTKSNSRRPSFAGSIITEENPLVTSGNITARDCPKTSRRMESTTSTPDLIPVSARSTSNVSINNHHLDNLNTKNLSVTPRTPGILSRNASLKDQLSPAIQAPPQSQQLHTKDTTHKSGASSTPRGSKRISANKDHNLLHSETPRKEDEHPSAASSRSIRRASPGSIRLKTPTSTVTGLTTTSSTPILPALKTEINSFDGPSQDETLRLFPIADDNELISKNESEKSHDSTTKQPKSRKQSKGNNNGNINNDNEHLKPLQYGKVRESISSQVSKSDSLGYGLPDVPH